MAVDNFAPVSVEVEQRADGTQPVRATAPLLAHEPSIVHAFRDGARRHPDRLLLAERAPDGHGRRRVTRGETAERFFASLQLGFCAAAALPQGLLERLRALAHKHGSTMEMTTSWGLTETSPAGTTAYSPIEHTATIGVPLPGIELELVPVGQKTELRLRGPNVTPGFYGRPDLTKAAFDEAGYLRTGDAVICGHDSDAVTALVWLAATMNA